MLMEFLLFLVLVLQCDLMTSENTQKHVRMTLNPTYISFNLRKSTRNLSRSRTGQGMCYAVLILSGDFLSIRIVPNRTFRTFYPQSQ